MLKIRYICGGLNWPPKDGTSLRQFAILQALAKLGEVDLVSLSMTEAAELVPPAKWRSLCRRAVVQSEVGPSREKNTSRIRTKLGAIGELFGNPRKAWTIDPGELNSGVTEILGGKYDLTWVSKLTSCWRFGIQGGPTHVLDLDDVRHREYFRQAGQGRHDPWRRWRYRIEGNAWQRAEKDALRKFAGVCVCSDLDVRYLNAENVSAVHNGVSVPEEFDFHAGTAGRMIFVGSMDYEPNVDGLGYFVRDILPRILAHRPDAVLHVVGRNPTPGVVALGAHPSVHIVGGVDEISPHLRNARLSVVPLRMGSGTRLKIVEALAAGSPVVSTSIGAEGLSLEGGVHLELADEPEEFAMACVRLLDDSGYRRQLAADGYRRVKESYSWKAVAEQVSKVAGAVLQKS